MKNKIILYSILSILLLTISCGPRRYKCGPNRRCENSMKNTDKMPFYKEFNKTYSC